LEPEALHMQVRQEAAALLVVRVRDAVTDGRLLAGDVADPGHSDLPSRIRDLGRPAGAPERARLYTSTPAWPQPEALQKAMLREGEATPVAHDQMVENPYVHQGEGI